MAKGQAKPDVKSGVEKKGRVKTMTTPVPLEAQEEVAKIEFWKSEIESLRSQIFNNSEEAMETLIESVLERYGITGPERYATREFVRILFDTDPIVQDQLRGVIRIKQ